MHDPIEPWIPIVLAKIVILWLMYTFFTYFLENIDYEKPEPCWRMKRRLDDQPDNQDMEAFVSYDATDDPAAFIWFQDKDY